MRRCNKGAALNRKRLKKTLRRRFVGRVRTRLLVAHGSYTGYVMYRMWRDAQALKGHREIKNPQV